MKTNLFDKNTYIFIGVHQLQLGAIAMPHSTNEPLIKYDATTEYLQFIPDEGEAEKQEFKCISGKWVKKDLQLENNIPFYNKKDGSIVKTPIKKNESLYTQVEQNLKIEDGDEVVFNDSLNQWEYSTIGIVKYKAKAIESILNAYNKSQAVKIISNINFLIPLKGGWYNTTLQQIKSNASLNKDNLCQLIVQDESLKNYEAFIPLSFINALHTKWQEIAIRNYKIKLLMSTKAEESKTKSDIDKIDISFPEISVMEIKKEVEEYIKDKNIADFDKNYMQNAVKNILFSPLSI